MMNLHHDCLEEAGEARVQWWFGRVAVWDLWRCGQPEILSRHLSLV